MGYKLVKNADEDNEIYLMPDEKKSLKNAPPFLTEEEKREDINDCYERNINIVDLQKQLCKKDKELKKATRSVITVDKNSLIACFSVLGIILVLAVIIAASIINNNFSPPVIPEQNITAEAPITVTEESSVSDESVSNDTDSTNTKTDEGQSLLDLIGIEIDEKIPRNLIIVGITFLITAIVMKMCLTWLHRMM